MVLCMALAISVAGGFFFGRGGAPAQTTEKEQAPARPEPAQAEVVSGTAETVVPFAWSQLESTNYPEFVSNLRAVSCPETTITDIIRGRLMRVYVPRLTPIVRPASYLKPHAHAREQIDKRVALFQEIDSILYHELKLQRPARSANTLFTAAQEELFVKVASRYPRISSSKADPEQAAQACSNRVARLEILSHQLSGEQLQYYKLDREGDAAGVEKFLLGMRPSKEEFLGVARVLEGKDTTLVKGTFKPDVLAELQRVLTPDRLGLLVSLQQPEYRSVVSLGQAYGAPPEKICTLLDLRRDMFARDPEGYRQRIQSLLTPPAVAAAFLGNKMIHPDVAAQSQLPRNYSVP